MSDWKVGDIINLDDENSTPPHLGRGTVYFKEVQREKHTPNIYYSNHPEFEGHRTESKFICESCGVETDSPGGWFFTGFHDIENECTTCHNGHITLRCGVIKEVRRYVPIIILKDNGTIFEMWQPRYIATCEDYPSSFVGYVKADNFEEVKKYFNDVVCDGKFNLGISDHEDN